MNPTPCLHGALPRLCAFAGCPHFEPDGPRDERWTFWPGATQADIDAALAENALAHARAPGSASPIHLVVNRHVCPTCRGFQPPTRIRKCPTCKGTGRATQEGGST